MAETLVMVASTIASVASTAGPALSAFSAIASLAQFGLGIAGAIGQADAQRAQAQQATFTATQQLMAAEQESLRGRSQAALITSKLVETLASQNARYAAAGIQLTGGTPDTVAQETMDQAERETTIVTTDAALRAAQQKAAASNSYGRASLLEDAADATLIGGIGGSIAGLGSSALRIADRLPGRTAGAAGGRTIGPFEG